MTFGRPRRRIVARRGNYALRLPVAERDLLRSLLAELRELLALSPDDPRSLRLYPTAYTDDPEEDAEYQRLMREELLAIRNAAVDTVEATLDAPELTPEQLGAWMQAVNSLRLVLGTMLDVGEDHDPFALDPSDPEARPHVLYGYLGVLLEEIVQAQTD